MKHLLFLLPLLFLVACQPEAETEVQAPDANVANTADYDAYGDALADDEAVPVTTVASAPETYEGQPVKVEGTIREVCQMKGCWFTFDEADNVRVEMPREEGDYKFTLPKDIAGRSVVVAGTLQASEMSVDEQQHYAEDAGASDEEVAAITEPKQVFRLTATGVQVKKVD